MRPLSQLKFRNSANAATRSAAPAKRLNAFSLAAFFAVLLCGCAQGLGALTAPPPPPPPEIQVSVTPQSSSIILGNAQTFVATVSNTSNTAVAWSVNGLPGGNPAAGTITSAGVYTAPADLPPAANVSVTATSAADPTKSGSASVAIVSDIVVQIAPNVAGVELGALQPFSGNVVSSGHPDTTLRWVVSGAACPNECGAVDASGNFTAPQILPAPAAVTLTAQSVADPSKQASASITVTSHFSLSISAPASVSTGATAAIVATLTPVPGSNPSTVLTWSLSGAGCSGSACGTLTMTTTQSVGGNKSADSATYTAPSSAPPPNAVVITVTPQADASKQALATLAIAAGVAVSISPSTATLAANHRVTLTPQVNGSANSSVLWNVNGVPGGNATLGQICVAASIPCQQVLNASSSPVDYVAPGAIPAPDPVTVQAVSAADATRIATAQITVINHVLVAVLPASVTLSPQTVQSFSATVLGSANQSVVWQISGTGCSAGGGVCGAIDANGTYTAPAAAPSPDAIQIIAVSEDDTTQSGAAAVIISPGVNLLSLHPASVYAGGLQGFTLRVDGSGFVPLGASAGSTLLIAGTARPTTCASATECIAPVLPADVSLAGTVTVQMRNPDGTQSNELNLVVAPPNISDATISLTSAAPDATGQDIVVVEPTTAGISSSNDDVDIDVGALGAFSSATNSCTLAGNPVTLLRPASGSITADLCLFSESGLDASMTITISGPGDVTVIARQPAGLGVLHITLLVPAGAAPGSRTLFIQTTNLDKTAASGAVQIE